MADHAKILRTCILEATADRVWAEINRPRLLVHIAKPLVRFRLPNTLDPESAWPDGEHKVTMWAFGVLPIGWQIVRIERPAPTERVRYLLDRGEGSTAAVWHHTISVESLPDSQTRYSDDVTIGAGWMTPLVRAFANIFFWHRQRRLAWLAAQGFAFR
jgi:hypothetical protein